METQTKTKETIKSRIELHVQTYGADCTLQDVAEIAYGDFVNKSQLQYTAQVIKDCGYSYKL
jgi:hypothetical protein